MEDNVLLNQVAALAVANSESSFPRVCCLANFTKTLCVFVCLCVCERNTTFSFSSSIHLVQLVECMRGRYQLDVSV